MIRATAHESEEADVRVERASLSFGFLSTQPVAAATDFFLLGLAGFLAEFLYDMPTPTASEMFGLVVIASTIFVALSYLTGGYQQQIGATRWPAILAAWRLWAITVCFLALAGFLLKIGAQFSRGSVLIFVLLAAALIAGERAIWPVLVRSAVDRGVMFVTRVLVLRVRGSRPSEPGRDEAEIQELRRCGLRPVAVRVAPREGAGERWAKVLEFVGNQLRLGQIEEIVLVADGDTLKDVEQAVARLRVFPLPVRLVLDPSMRRLLERNLSRTGSCVLAEYQRAPLNAWERAVKRALDVGLALFGLLLLSPMFAMIAIAIKLDTPGPVLFRQFRRGFGGRPFTILKFRSMTVSENGADVVQATRGDVRVTRVGRWIRRTSIDELPQLLNVLGGDMSIVGPRPHAVAHDDYYARFIEEYAFRHHAKPGLTGWAQVQGLRGETPRIENMQARIEKDLWYIDHWSLWLDVVIILRTIVAVFRHKTAY